MRVTSLGFRTDVALRVLEGAEVTDRGDYLVVRSPDNPDFWWGNFLLLAAWPGPGTGDRWLARFAAEFPLARHIALGVDSADPDTVLATHPTSRDDEDRRLVPAEFVAAGLEPQRDTVLTCAAVGPPPHPNAAAEIRRLESDADWQQSTELGRALLRPGRVRATTWNDRRRPGGGSPRRAAGRGSAPSPAAGCSPSSGCSTRATDTPGTSMSRPTRRPGARAWPGRSSGTRAATDARPSGRAPSSSWPTRRMWPSGSTAPAGSPTPNASSASSGRPRTDVSQVNGSTAVPP